ncbi:c-type cytochrome [Lentisphaera profundi]|uniref:C-type cytochrome n=1 Tax=Lentisphaera profundi TaxID=1658616 RepID=A0ABY7VPS3_9BACT|nr:PVC-type heme-binding CxxCH protein [Lentisphaera profundi]WDE95707.1 c-type cytochrome [Lentisphaera profundi]
MKSMRIFLSLMILPAIISAQGIQAKRSIPYSPEQEKATFQLADGFVAELVASEKNGLINPIDLTFDDAGRLWTQTAQMYPLDPITGIHFGKAMRMMRDPNLAKKDPRFTKMRKLYRLEEKGQDKILIINDPSKAVQGQIKSWADGLTIPQSIMPYKNGCFVAHGSELFFLSDENKNGKQDKMTPVLTGFGFFDTHTMAHSIVRAPGGWMQLSHGAINSGLVTAVKSGKKQEITFSKNLRFSTDGKELELVNCHKDNNWGYQLRANGQWYSTSANDGGYSVFPSEAQSSIPGIGGKKIRQYSPYMPNLHKFRVGGSGISGLAFSEDGAQGFPAEWKDVAILANPITNSINCVKIIRKPDGSIEAKHLKDLLVSKDKWFRPVNIEFGPDGCLYVADWYNKIISHNEVSTDHPDRDRKHGRIWRIRHKSQKPLSIPNVAQAPDSKLIHHLVQGKTLWEKRAAWHQIEERQAKELFPQLVKVAINQEISKESRILALWSMEALKIFNQSTLQGCIADSDADIRREAIRSLASYNLSSKIVAVLLTTPLNDKNAMVRSQVLRTLDEIHNADDSTISLLIQACKPAAPNDALGGNYERNFERFLARKALERYPNELKNFLAKTDYSKLATTNILWAIQALPAQELSKVFVQIWGEASSGNIDANTFIAISKILNNPAVRQAVTPTFHKRPEEFLQIALANIDKINIANISSLYAESIESDLASNSLTNRNKALDLIIQLQSPHHSKTLLQLIKGGDDKSKIIQALGNTPHLAFDIYRQLFFQENLNFTQKLSIFAAYAIKNESSALIDCKLWFPHLTKNQKGQVVNHLSYTRQGNNILKNLWEISYLADNQWDYNSAYRTMSSSKRDWRGQKIYEYANSQEQIAINKRKDQIEKFIHSSAKTQGNVTLGKAFFQTCLTCHKVGDQGQSIAPPLDGSANREREHIITAIVNPDEAMEGVYGLYSAVRKDGSYLEGYLAKNDANGITIATMGGYKSFIPKANILSHGSVHKRSFMPNGFGELSEQSMADLLAYIKTLK